MERRSLVIFTFIALLSFLLVVISNLAVNAQTDEGPFVVKFSYAPPKIRKGDVWKTYLSVSDTEGNMTKVSFPINESGGTRYRSVFMYLKKGMQKEFMGYFALHTAASRDLSGIGFMLGLSTSDDKGNHKDLSFPLEFDGREIKPLPPDMEKVC